LAFAAVLAAPAAAMATDYQSIERVERIDANQLSIYATPVGKSQSVQFYVNGGDYDVNRANACERYALIALTHPGRFLFTIDDYNSQCSLAPRNP
jgi:hypothetical protein